MIRVAIWDDEQIHVQILKQTIEKISKENEINVKVEVATSKYELIEQAVKQKLVDVLFLDISTKENEKFGLTFAEKLREYDSNFYLIFQTANNQFAFDSFKCKTFDYILKPIEPLKIESVLMRIDKDMKSKRENKFIEFPNSISINSDEILYIEKCGHRDKIFTSTSFYYTYGSLSAILEKLPSNFSQSHRAFIVNHNRISSIDFKSKTIYFDKTHSCPISNSYIKKFN